MDLIKRFGRRAYPRFLNIYLADDIDDLAVYGCTNFEKLIIINEADQYENYPGFKNYGQLELYWVIPLHSLKIEAQDYFFPNWFAFFINDLK